MVANFLTDCWSGLFADLGFDDILTDHSLVQALLASPGKDRFLAEASAINGEC